MFKAIVCGVSIVYTVFAPFTVNTRGAPTIPLPLIVIPTLTAALAAPLVIVCPNVIAPFKLVVVEEIISAFSIING